MTAALKSCLLMVGGTVLLFFLLLFACVRS
jgi:hypothetical protein